MKEKEIPFVVTGTIHDENVYQVDVDQRGGCRDLTNILFKTGIRKTALFCSDMRQSVMDGRYKGYIDAIQENELPMECDLVVENAKDENVLEKAVGDEYEK